MKNLLAFILLTLFISGCSHYKWVAKHQAEICAKCPQESTTENSQTDTTYYGEIPPDTIRIYGLDTITNTVIVDNPVYKIIKEKGEVKVIIKEKRVPFTVTKYRTSSDQVKTIEKRVMFIPWWLYCLLPILVLFGFYLRKFLFK